MNKQNLKIADEYIERIIECQTGITLNKWVLGDILVDLIDKHKLFDRSEVLYQIAGETRINYSALDEYERTSRRWKMDDRDYSIDWSIFRNADENDRWLVEKAIEEGWNVTKFKEEKYPGINAPVRLITKMLKTIQALSRKVPQDQAPVLERILNITIQIEELQIELEQLEKTKDTFLQ